MEKILIAILEACDFNRVRFTYRVAFELLYFCGLRRGELLALTWKHINFDINELSVKQNLVENRL